jgi:hypothetical protein
MNDNSFLGSRNNLHLFPQHHFHDDDNARGSHFHLLQNEFNFFFKMLKLKTMCYKFQKFIEKIKKLSCFYTCFKLVAKTN